MSKLLNTNTTWLIAGGAGSSPTVSSKFASNMDVGVKVDGASVICGTITLMDIIIPSYQQVSPVVIVPTELIGKVKTNQGVPLTEDDINKYNKASISSAMFVSTIFPYPTITLGALGGISIINMTFVSA